jgi:RNAse (barnase) inhibitor barstar
VTGGMTPIVDGTLPPGRYRLGGPVSLRTIRTDISDAGWYDAIVNGRAIDGRAALFDQFAQHLRFPDWFGGNWDAFADCLRDLSWLSGPGVIVLWQHYGMFAGRLSELAERTDEVIDEAIATRVEIELPPLFVIYPGARDGVTGSGAWKLQPAQ